MLKSKEKEETSIVNLSLEKYSGWVWLSKVKDSNEYHQIQYHPHNFNKRKRRYMNIYDSYCYYSHNSDNKDAKSIPLITYSPLIILGENDLPSFIYLIDSVTRYIYVVIEPENIHHTTILCSILTLVCDNSRILSMINIIDEDNNEKLTEILNYCRHTKSLMEASNFSCYGSAIHYTLSKKSIKCLPIIFYTLGVSCLSLENSQHLLPIHVAVLSYDETLLKSFIDLVGNIGIKSNELLNMSNHYLQTPLHFITDEEIIPLLVQYGANIDSFDSNGLTPLMTACKNKLTYVAIEFMDFGVNVDKPCWVNGLTPLMFSCLPGNDELVKELLDRNADINRLDNFNRTALHHACMNGHIFSCVLLLNLGINLDLQDIFGATSLCYSAASPIGGSIAATHEIIGLLIARGSYPKIRDICGRQALHYAAECGNDIAINLLLANGSDPNAVDHSGKTALDIVESKLDELVLRNVDAPIDSPTQSKAILHGLMGGSAIDIADDLSEESSSDILKQSSTLAIALPTFALQLMVQGLGLNFSSENIPERKSISSNSQQLERFQRCSQILLSNGAGRRMNAEIPLETNCRDMTFSYSRNGTYSVASGTPWAIIWRLTTFPHFSSYHAASLLSTYRLYLEPLQLLKLIKLRFYMLTDLSTDLLSLLHNSSELLQLGVFLNSPRDISKFLLSLSSHSNLQHSATHDESHVNDSLEIKKNRPVSVRMKQSSQQLISVPPDNDESDIFSNLPEKAISYVKGIDSFIKYDHSEKTLLFRSVYLGKPISFSSQRSTETQIDKFFSSLHEASSCIELYGDNLFILCRNKFCQISNCRIIQEYVSDSDWSLKIFNDQETESTFLVCNHLFPEKVFHISLIELVCHSVSRLMRGKIIIELRVHFTNELISSNHVSISGLELLATHYRDIMSEVFASCLSEFVFNKISYVKSKPKEETHSPNSRLSRKLDIQNPINVLHSIESELIHHEGLPSLSQSLKRNELLKKTSSEQILISQQMDRAMSNDLQSSDSIDISINTSKSMTQMSEMSEQTSAKSVGDSIDERKDMNKFWSIDSSIRGCLQLLMIWCVDFYEDDFEQDPMMKLEMGNFIETVMSKYHELIEDEFDPNAFAPFLNFETNSLLDLIETSISDDKETDGTSASTPKRSSTLGVSKRTSARNSCVADLGLQNNRVSIVHGTRGSILSKRLTTMPMVPPKKRGTVLLNAFDEDEFDINCSLPSPSSPSTSPRNNQQQQQPHTSNKLRTTSIPSNHTSNSNLITRSSSVELNIRSGTLSLDYNLLEFPVDEIAEQITLLQHNLFCRIRRIEFIEPKQSQYSHVKQLNEFSIHWMDFMISQLLSCENSYEIIKKIHYFLDLLIYLKQIHNYYGMFEIITILETTSIYRLKSAWIHVDKKKLEIYLNFKNLFSSKNNFTTFRNEMKSNPIIPPCMPYLGLYQKDFISLTQLPTRLSNGMINVTKMSSISSKLLELSSYQKIPYHFTEDSHIIHMLKAPARYQTEEEQYQRSLVLEPLTNSKR